MPRVPPVTSQTSYRRAAVAAARQAENNNDVGDRIGVDITSVHSLADEEQQGEEEDDEPAASIAGRLCLVTLAWTAWLVLQIAIYATLNYVNLSSSNGWHVISAWMATLFIAIVFHLIFLAITDQRNPAAIAADRHRRRRVNSFHPHRPFRSNVYLNVMAVPAIMAQISFALTVFYVIGTDAGRQTWISWTLYAALAIVNITIAYCIGTTIALGMPPTLDATADAMEYATLSKRTANATADRGDGDGDGDEGDFV